MVLPWKALKEGCRLRHGVSGLHSFHLISDRLLAGFFLEAGSGVQDFFEKADRCMDCSGKSMKRWNEVRGLSRLMGRLQNFVQQ